MAFLEPLNNSTAHLLKKRHNLKYCQMLKMPSLTILKPEARELQYLTVQSQQQTAGLWKTRHLCSIKQINAQVIVLGH